MFRIMTDERTNIIMIWPKLSENSGGGYYLIA